MPTEVSQRPTGSSPSCDYEVWGSAEGLLVSMFIFLSIQTLLTLRQVHDEAGHYRRVLYAHTSSPLPFSPRVIYTGLQFIQRVKKKSSGGPCLFKGMEFATKMLMHFQLFTEVSLKPSVEG